MMQFEAAGGARALRFAPEQRQRSAGRRAWTATALMVAGTLAVALTSYSISLKVSAERAEAERLAKQNVALEARLKALEAELRVRMRLPQLQRWNDEVLALKPITSAQYLGTSLHLAAYGEEPQAMPGAVPQATLAAGPLPAKPAMRPALRTEIAPRADTGLKLTAATLPPPSAPASRPQAVRQVAAAPQPAPAIDPQLVAAIEAMAESEAGEARPADLLRQVDMPSPPPGGN